MIVIKIESSGNFILTKKKYCCIPLITAYTINNFMSFFIFSSPLFYPIKLYAYHGQITRLQTLVSNLHNYSYCSMMLTSIFFMILYNNAV